MEYCATCRLFVPDTCPTDRTVKEREEVVPPPGAGVDTVNCKTPGLATRLAGTVAVSWLALTNVVAREVALAITADCEVNPAPFSVSIVPVAGTCALLLPPIPIAAGEIELSCGAGFEMVSVREAIFAVSATLVAWTATVFGEGGTAGAVYIPLEVMVPTDEFPLATPFTDHVTEVLLLPVTVAVNCTVCPTTALVDWEETETDTAEGDISVLVLLLPQLESRIAWTRTIASKDTLRKVVFTDVISSFLDKSELTR
jgi:hypothetical protein